MNALFVASILLSTHYTVAPVSTVSFTGHITTGTFEGKSEAVTGEITTGEDGVVDKGCVTVKADSFKTGIGGRDNHLKDKYLEAAKFPVITLDLAGAKLPEKEGEVDGTFEVHGVKKPVKIHVTVTEEAGATIAKGAFPVVITDYNIEQPKFAVIKMQTTVDVTVSIRFVSK